MWVVVFLLLMAGLAVFAWLVHSGRVSLADWSRRLDRLLGMETRDRYQPDYFSDALAAQRAEPEWEAPVASPEPTAPAAPAEPAASAYRHKETITLPPRPAPSALPPQHLPTLELSRDYRKKNRALPREPQRSALPVIGLSELQLNLQKDYRRRQLQRGGEPLRTEAPALPVIAPGEVRAKVETLHAGRPLARGSEPPRPAASALPLIAPGEVRAKVDTLHGMRRQQASVSTPPLEPVVLAPVLPAPQVLRPPAAQSGWLNPSPRPVPAPSPSVESPVVPSSAPTPAVEPSSPEAEPLTVPPLAAPAAEPTLPVADLAVSAEVTREADDALVLEALPEIADVPERTPWRWPQTREVLVQADDHPTIVQQTMLPETQAPSVSEAVQELAARPSPWVLIEPPVESAPVAASPAGAVPGMVWHIVDEPPLAAAAATSSSPPATDAPELARVKPSYDENILPTLDLLRPAEQVTVSCSEDELLERGILIEEKLAEFKVKVSVVDAYAGPVITRYEVEPAVGVRGNQVVNLMKDLSRALGLASIRVVETIPGKTCMGLELPNARRQMIRLSEILSAEVFEQSASRLTLVLGKDISGAPVVMDLAKAPHLLVAGTTGSGKSVGVNAMIVSMLYKATPDEVRFIMIDPKMLELSVYNDIPHLLAPVVTDMKLAANALNWCVGEMERRYRLMSALGVRNLAGYNQKVKAAALAGKKLTNPFSLTPETPEPLENLPFIVVVVDEFADLMMVAGKKIEELIARLAQKARAAGIHLILATQRPSVDVITGLIKANIPTRIAFQVSSKIDSRTILDQMGAESLLGQGDMLFLPPGTGYPQRVHGAFVTDDEVHAVVEHLKQFGEPDYVEGLLTGESEAEEESAAATSKAQAATESDPLYDEAVEIVLRTRKPSISGVQRHLRIGYNRAARLIEQMEASGIVSAMESNGNRTVLVPQRDF